VLPQALEIIFEVQRKRNNEKIIRKKISFPTYKTCFSFFFLFFGPLLLSNLITFLYVIHLKQFKVLWEHHLKFYKSSNSLYVSLLLFKEFLGMFGNWHL